jgi:hypothetical protein
MRVSRTPGRRSRRARQLAAMVLAFAAATLIAKLAGAGWGTASAFGQIAFAAALVAVLLEDPGREVVRRK